ncbi:MAG: ABC transporter substrate-binding protein [Lachnospiraceae bacterium]
MRKKILASMLAVFMTVSLLAGCGSTSSDSSDVSSTESGSTTSDSYSEENPYHLTFAYVEFYEQDEAARTAVQDAMNEILIPEYHIELELLPLQYAEYQSTIQLMLSGGDELDVIPVYYTDASSWINMGGIYDMSELLTTEDGQKIVTAIGEDNATVGTMNGVLYGFPPMKESVELGGLAMRADICDELGITEEFGLADQDGTYDGTYYSWDVAESIFAKVKEAYPSMTPLYMSNPSQMNRFAFFDTLSDSFGVLDWESDHSSTTVVNEYETETYKNAVTMLARWYDSGYIYPDAATDTQGTATMMKAGNTFSYLSAIKPGFITEAEAANGCEMYSMYFGDHKEGGLASWSVNFFNTAIASNSKDPAMAFKFISALYSDARIMNLWQNGIEGVNYQVLEDGTAYFVDGEDSANYKYHQGTGWFLGNQFISYVWNDGSKTPDYWEQLQAHNDWAELSPAYGFMWDSSSYSTQITALYNALETYRAALETGSVGSANVESTLESLNSALYAAGLQDVMDAKQAQLDEWLAAQN